MGFWWSAVPRGKSPLSPDRHRGPPWTFHCIKIDVPQTTCTISCSIVEGAVSTLGPHIGAPVNPAANGMTKKNPRCLDNLVVCNLFFSELKPGLITTTRQTQGMSQLKGGFHVCICIRGLAALPAGLLAEPQAVQTLHHAPRDAHIAER